MYDKSDFSENENLNNSINLDNTINNHEFTLNRTDIDTCNRHRSNSKRDTSLDTMTINRHNLNIDLTIPPNFSPKTSLGKSQIVFVGKGTVLHGDKHILDEHTSMHGDNEQSFQKTVDKCNSKAKPMSTCSIPESDFTFDPYVCRNKILTVEPPSARNMANNRYLHEDTSHMTCENCLMTLAQQWTYLISLINMEYSEPITDMDNNRLIRQLEIGNANLILKGNCLIERRHQSNDIACRIGIMTITAASIIKHVLDNKTLIQKMRQVVNGKAEKLNWKEIFILSSYERKIATDYAITATAPIPIQYNSREVLMRDGNGLYIHRGTEECDHEQLGIPANISKAIHGNLCLTEDMLAEFNQEPLLNPTDTRIIDINKLKILIGIRNYNTFLLRNPKYIQDISANTEYVTDGEDLKMKRHNLTTGANIQRDQCEYPEISIQGRDTKVHLSSKIKTSEDINERTLHKIAPEINHQTVLGNKCCLKATPTITSRMPDWNSDADSRNIAFDELEDVKEHKIYVQRASVSQQVSGQATDKQKTDQDLHTKTAI